MSFSKRPSSLFALAISLPLTALAASPTCEVKSGDKITPVLELYTSEGCSSCPPADQWLSTLKGQPVVAQAFHVGYWDYIGWVDRFATRANTTRQREIASINHLRNIYTPQFVRNGQDWRDYTRVLDSTMPAKANIVMQRTQGADSFKAMVTPASGVESWSAYWSVTEHGHSSRVKAGENSGEFLKHDFVVRQHTSVGTYQGAQTLNFSSIAAQAEHPRQINLVVSDPKTGAPLQAVSLSCS
ncbi:thioredoxin family protein [Rhodoferax sp. PAMC 29310]|uniref:DUF1223 domain-containing protein n=1 Tax=Rhodoferax sp. PAMC 29310 TaxID=2822760 RepID=UPI001B33CA21|nr:DUF1223 domain-containing protein [Rhodoferax sp. PAMC 29310]